MEMRRTTLAARGKEIENVHDAGRGTNFPAVFSFPPSFLSEQTFSLIALHTFHRRLLKIHVAINESNIAERA